MQGFQVNTDPGKLLDGIRCFVLDMDGTVYLGRQWIDGAMEFLQRLEDTGRSYVFLTNNSSKPAAAYLQKLAGMGLATPPERLATSGQATIAYLRREYPGRRVYLLGNVQLRREFAEAGIALSEDAPELLVTAFDTELTYEKLRFAADLLRAGLPFVATHPDFNCPTETGFMPDIGAIHAFLEASTGRRPDFVVGKPNPEVMRYALAQAGAAAEHSAIVGDRLYTDIAAGHGANIASILVLSGEASLEELRRSPHKPDLVFSSVAAITPLL